MDPATLMTVFKVVGGVSSAVGAASKGMQDSANLDAQAALEKTQGLQRDTQARNEMDAYLNAMSSARATTNLNSNSPNAVRMEMEANKLYGTDRLVQKGNSAQKVANLRAASASAKRGARMSLFTGVLSAGIPLAQHQMNEA